MCSHLRFQISFHLEEYYHRYTLQVDGFVQDCNNSSAVPMKLPQSSTNRICSIILSLMSLNLSPFLFPHTDEKQLD